MKIKAFSYSENGKENISEHFFVKNFASATYSKLFSDLILIDLKIPEILEKVWSHFNCKKIYIISAYRTAEHEFLLGKKGTSLHTFGRAVDFKVRRFDDSFVPSNEIKEYLELLDIYGIKIVSSEIVHIDTRIRAMKSDKKL